MLTSHTPRPNFVDTIPERFSFVEDAEDDVAMDVEDLELGNERHTRTHGPVTAVEQVFILTPSSPPFSSLRN